MTFLYQLILYGCIGVLLEVLFTGLSTVIIDRNLRATCQTYLWMWPIYGLAGTLFSGIHHYFATIHQPFAGALFVFFAVIHIYIFEFSAGFLLEKLIGRCPWSYGQTRYSIMGLIRLDYWWVWLAVAMGYNWLASGLDKILSAISTIYP